MKNKHFLAVLAAALIFVSCETDNDTECDKAAQDYMQALQFAKTPEARAEVTRQYQDKVSNLNC